MLFSKGHLGSDKSSDWLRVGTFYGGGGDGKGMQFIPEKDVQVVLPKPVPYKVLLLSHDCFDTNNKPTVSVFKKGDLPSS